MTIGVLPHNDGEVGGCLSTSAEEKPNEKGIMIYLNATVGWMTPSRRSCRTAAGVCSRSIRSGHSVRARSSSTAKATELRCIRIKEIHDGAG